MVIAKMTGGLGNQMFQYAAGRAASLRTKNRLALDVSFFEVTLERQNHEVLDLLRVFPNIFALNIETIDYSNIQSLEIKREQFIHRYYNALRKKLGVKPNYKVFKEENLLHYQSNFHVQNAKILRLISDFQNEKYFSDYAAIIRKDFTFPTIDHISPNTPIMYDIQNNNSISIHVRRGDYLSSSIHQPISTDYYTKAINLINTNVLKPKFFVFSDDIEWCRQNFISIDAYYVECNSGKNSYIDMHLMSCCKHNIIANSSFSWWGAWLNDNETKIVISPKIWLNSLDIKSANIIPDNWITL